MEQKPTYNQPIDVTKKQHFTKLKAFLKKRPTKKHLAIFGGVSAGILLAGVLGVKFLWPKPADPNPVPEVVSSYTPPAPTTVASPLTGILVAPDVAKRSVTGIMVENSIDARPQSALNEAGIVFEAIAEGGITRFLALFQEARPGNVGPIRSARPYYVQWVAGYDASYLHSGGSSEALALIRSLGVKDLDHGNYGERIAKRVSSRYAPHNVYSNFDTIDALNSELGYNSSTFTPFTRKEPTKPVEGVALTATKIAFDISGANYNTSYTYDAATNSYARVLAGRPHTDQDSGKQISPTVVVALVTEYSLHPDGVHSVYRTTGTGKVMVFQDGNVTTGTWKKNSAKESLELLGTDGNALALNAGQTWITAIPDGRVTYTP
jgi:hypothetical protein